jgi:uncharacterized protein (TIGR02271 family)
MNQSDRIIVTGRDNLRGAIERSAWPPRTGETQVPVLFDNGAQVLVPLEALVLQADGSYFLPISRSEVERQMGGGYTPQAQQEVQSREVWGNENIVVPVVVEELDVQRRQVETGRVRLTKVVREHEEMVDEPLLREEVTVERAAINQLVNEPVPVRYEGDTMIVPVLEEILVVEKRLVLKEEIRITRQRVERREPQRVTLRSEEVMVERVDPSDPRNYQRGGGTDIA